MLRQYLPEIWYRDAPPPRALRVLARLYGAVATRRAGRPSARPPVPVIVVGNLTAGGTGKTPLVMHLAGLLAAAGYEPAVISRGYGGSEPAVPHRVSSRDSAAKVGDEPRLIHARTGRPVWVGRRRDRVLAAAVAGGADVVISDDGLQHEALPRTLELCVVDADRRFGNGWLLPAGPLRQPVSRLDSVDAVICREHPGGARARQSEIPMRLKAAALVSLADGSRIDPDALPSPSVSAVAGIGNPEGFFTLLEELGYRVHRHPLPDHAALDPARLAGLSPPVVMTAKDAARLDTVTDPRWWKLEVDTDLPESFDTWVLDRMAAGRKEGA